MATPRKEIREVMRLAARAASGASAAWRAVAECGGVAGMRKSAARALRCQERAEAAIAWAVAAHRSAGDPVRGPGRLREARQGAEAAAEEVESLLRAAAEADREEPRGDP